ncbi:hypothetical protein B0I35DRAFT_421421 [Stachybotrys elegans]|uniref:Uncharacterized protein n=1 Tax=Stachybotrys elegans TaxID=80388 RepID=A0A8K0WUR5_9HYPO|nr:hypothetical protein B0I35DRAFT_421421 [Stachybotrys elegans]
MVGPSTRTVGHASLWLLTYCYAQRTGNMSGLVDGLRPSLAPGRRLVLYPIIHTLLQQG